MACIGDGLIRMYGSALGLFVVKYLANSLDIDGLSSSHLIYLSMKTTKRKKIQSLNDSLCFSLGYYLFGREISL